MSRNWRVEVQRLGRSVESHIRLLRAEKPELSPSPDYARGFRAGALRVRYLQLASLRHLLGLCPRCAMKRPPGSSVMVCEDCRKVLVDSNAETYLIPNVSDEEER